jgi:hypothetical protein
MGNQTNLLQEKSTLTLLWRRTFQTLTKAEYLIFPFYVGIVDGSC